MSRSLFRKKSLDKILKEAAQGETDGHSSHLNRVLNVKDLTFMGIAAVVGAGIFSTIGKAAFDGGPGISLLFVITAVTCGFSALCYAEFASRVPIAGSACSRLRLQEGWAQPREDTPTDDPGPAATEVAAAQELTWPNDSC